ncbi:MAG TPA: radical SAM protein [Verrucomicrobiales bacterium]|nr:radical SAM protein [Verrucomicrobiales bacterium]
MLISEIFYSVQGEGVLTGVPSVFIRTSGCNLRCRWCDTPYASWSPEGEDLSPAEILTRIGAWPAARHTVLTGGEPMVARGIRELAEALRERGLHITIETAGTVAPEGIACDLASLSPKLYHSTPLAGEIEAGWIERHERLRLKPDVLRAWLDSGAEYQLKFVVSTEADLEEIHALLKSLERTIPPDRVLLMPEGRTMEELRARGAWLVDVCRETGHRFCHRLHIELFGNRRGT